MYIYIYIYIYPTRREEYWRRVLKTVTPYGLNTVG